MGAGTDAGSGSIVTLILPFALMFGLMWLLMIRPQQKQQSKRKDMLSNLSKGDKIVTVGGIHAQIVRFRDDTVLVKLADNMEIEIDRSAIGRCLTLHD